MAKPGPPAAPLVALTGDAAWRAVRHRAGSARRLPALLEQAPGSPG